MSSLLIKIKQHPYYSSLLALFAVYTLAGFFLAPYLLEKSLRETMQERFDASLAVESVEINPLVLSLRVRNLALDNPTGEPTLRLGEFFANLQLSSLFRLAVTFDEISLSASEVFVSRDQQGDFDFNYLISGQGQDETPQATTEDEESGLLPVLISQFVISDFVVHWTDLLPAEPVETQFGPIAISIEDLNTLPERSGLQTVVIDTENLGTLKWTGDVQLNPLRSSASASLEGARFELISAYISHQAGIDVVDGEAGIKFDYEISQNDDGQLLARINNLALQLDNIVINSFADGTGFDFAGEDQQILALPALQVSGTNILWPEQTVSIGSINIDNPQISSSRDARGVFNLAAAPGDQDNTETETEVTESAEATATSPGSTGNGWQVAIDEFAINNLQLDLVDNSVTPAAQLGIQAFNLNLKDINNQPGTRIPTAISMQSQSGGNVRLDGNIVVLPEPVVDFDLQVDGLALTAVNPYINQLANLGLASGEINLQAQLSHNADEPFAYQGNFEIANLAVIESIEEKRLTSWQSVSSDSISFSLQQKRLDISQVQIEQLYGDILIDSDGTLNLGQVAKQPEEQAPDSTEVTEEPLQEDEVDTSEPFAVQIGGVVINEASADFTDLSLPLPFAVKIEALNGKMTTIDNQSVEPSELSFEGKVDDYGLARVSGFITPLEPNLNTDIRLNFQNIDVPKFTPYTIPFAGREIANGTLDLSLGYQIKDSELLGDNSIVLRDFELGEEIPHPDALDVPLGLAVALLKDPSGRIAIDLPVSGNVDDPEFSYGGVVWRALGNLLVKIVLSPFSMLGNLLGIEASELENFNFIVGRADLTPPEVQRSEKLAEALALRPELQLVIAGVFDAAADGLAIRKAAVENQLELEIRRLTETAEPSVQYQQHRRTALETMLGERLGSEQAAARLLELQATFTTETVVEGQSQPQLEFDNLAYTKAITEQLVESQPLADNALQQLADARASSLQSALLAIDASLQSRIIIKDNQPVEETLGDIAKMAVSLEANP